MGAGTSWGARVAAREAVVSVVGLGYVGLPLGVEIARQGFRVIGIDIDTAKVDELAQGECRSVVDVEPEALAAVVAGGKLQPTTDYARVAEADAIILCVPTPLNKTKDPDVSFIVDACQRIAPHLRREQLVVLESTTYPGFTREAAVPLLEATGLTCGTDVHVAFSPERIDPGNPVYGVRNTTKIVGGLTPECTERTMALYACFIDKLHAVSSPDTAEMVKLLENTFRAVNIGLVNEVALMCHRLGVDTWEVIDAAATKPFGFMPFYPGPGLGGHCIPIDPLYLSWKLRSLNYQARFIELAHAVNSSMPAFAVSLVQDALNDHAKPLRGARALVVGVAYKKDIDDFRESPSLLVLDLLEAKGAIVEYYDPYVPRIHGHGPERIGVPTLDDLAVYDVVVIATAHTCIDYADLVARAALVVDCRNATRGVASDKAIVRL